MQLPTKQQGLAAVLAASRSEVKLIVGSLILGKLIGQVVLGAWPVLSAVVQHLLQERLEAGAHSWHEL